MMRIDKTSIAAAAVFAALSFPALAGPVQLSETDVDALGRVVYAEAASEPVAGKAAVLGVILNRLASGTWGSTVAAVVDARSQFEPVLRSGCGSWRCLPALSEEQAIEFATILQLAATGKLADVSGGASHFQNPVIVARRAREGRVRPSTVGFGGMPVTASIGAHTFYRTEGSTAAMPPPTTMPARGTAAWVQPATARLNEPGVSRFEEQEETRFTE